MRFGELKRLVAAGEGQQVEFKRKAAHPDKIMKEVVAFANADGGRLLVGVSDDLTIPGLKNADEEEFVMEQALRRYCYPEVHFWHERVRLPGPEGRFVLVFTIPPGKDKPYEVRTQPDSHGKVYVRVGASSVQASREVRQILRQRRKNKQFRFQYGEKEQVLMRYLAEHGHITLSDFVVAAHIPPQQASRTLVLLVLAGVLRVAPREQRDLYYAVEHSV